MSNLRLLGVLDPAGRFDSCKAESVGEALCLAADSFDALQSTQSWALVATMPPKLHALLHPPPMRQTGGVLLELVDGARKEIIIPAPFTDARAVTFLTDSFLAAGRRGVVVIVVTSPGEAPPFADLAKKWPSNSPGMLGVTEVLTDLSPLGSHAKVLAVDRSRGYVGSANITGAGLGRHLEIGVEVSGPQIEQLVEVLIALERVGTHVLLAGPVR